MRECNKTVIADIGGYVRGRITELQQKQDMEKCCDQKSRDAQKRKTSKGDTHRHRRTEKMGRRNSEKKNWRYVRKRERLKRC